MPTNTKFSPRNESEFEAKSVNSDNKGLKFLAIKNTTTDGDLLLSEDSMVSGGIFHVINGCLGDYVKFQVIDKDNIIGFGENFVLGQYITDWFINPNITLQCELDSKYPAKINAGLYLRIKYYSDSLAETDAIVILNYKIHRVLW